MPYRLIAAGGGTDEDARLLDDRFANWVGPSGKVLYVPVPNPTFRTPYATYLECVRSIFAPRGIANIPMWLDLPNAPCPDLSLFDAVYLGGGNTFVLLQAMRKTGFDTALARFMANGGIVYGRSAGAVVLGADIGIAEPADVNTIGLTETTGLNVLDGYAVWCHYMPQDDARIAEYVRQTGIPVLAIPEKAGIERDGDRLLAIGYDSVPIFLPHGTHVAAPRDEIK